MTEHEHHGVLRLPFGRGEPQTKLGMTLAFKPMTSRVLGDIPAQVVAIWPRFRSGDYLVTLEYAAPIPYHGEVIQRIEAFRTELYQPPAVKSLSLAPGKASHRPWRSL